MKKIVIQQKIEEQIRNKTSWKTVNSTEYEEITENEYNNIIDENWLKILRSLGGIESVQKNYTPLGYVPIKILSTSPDRTERKIRYFKIFLSL